PFPSSPPRWGSGREQVSSLPPRDAGRPDEQPAEVLVQLREDRARDRDLDRFDGFGAADPMDDERPGELLGSLVGGRQASQRKDFPVLHHGRYLTAMVIALDVGAVHARTGCHLHASYWPAKLRWLNRERPAEVRRVARWGSFGEHLELELFGEAATSVSMASATGLLDQASARWDREALAAGEIDDGRLFPLRDWAEARRGPRAPWAMRWPALRGADWFPAVGDGAASNIGSDCTDPSRIALNVGTSAALRVVTTAPLEPPRGLWRYRLDRRR